MIALFTCINEPTNEVKYKTDSIRKSSSFFFSLQRDVTYNSVIASFLPRHLATSLPLRGQSQQSEGRLEIWCMQSLLFLR